MTTVTTHDSHSRRSIPFMRPLFSLSMAGGGTAIMSAPPITTSSHFNDITLILCALLSLLICLLGWSRGGQNRVAASGILCLAFALFLSFPAVYTGLTSGYTPHDSRIVLALLPLSLAILA